MSTPPEPGTYYTLGGYTLRHVTADEYTPEEWQEEEHIVIGRGRKKDYGTRIGANGSLTIQLYDLEGGDTARQQRLMLEFLKRNAIQTGTTLTLVTPWGDEFEVLPGEISFSRTPGVGMREFGTVSITYAETAP